MGADWITSTVAAGVLLRPPQVVALLFAAQRRLSWGATPKREGGDLSTTPQKKVKTAGAGDGVLHSLFPYVPKEQPTFVYGSLPPERDNKRKRDGDEVEDKGPSLQDVLPVELIVHIFSFITKPKHLSHLLSVSSQVHELASSNAVWALPFREHVSTDTLAILQEANLVKDSNRYYDLLRLSVYLNSEEVQMERVEEAPQSSPFVDFNHPTSREEETHAGGALPETFYRVCSDFNLSGVIGYSNQALPTVLISGDRRRDVLLPFHGVLFSHVDPAQAPVLETSVIGPYEASHYDCKVGLGVCWLTADQKSQLERCSREELDYHGPYEWAIALTTA